MAKTPYTHIMLTLEGNSTYGHIYAQPVVRKADGELDYGYVSYYDELPIALCQMDNHSERSYAWKVEYRGAHGINVSRATSMYKFLSAIDRKMQAYEKEDGPCTTYAQHVLRYAKAVGIKSFLVKSKRYPGEYTQLGAQDAFYAVTEMERTWLETHSNNGAMRLVS